jgi:DNA polymerase-3 subunit alpha
LQKFRRKFHKYITEEELNGYIKNTVKIAKQIEKYSIITKTSPLPEFAGSREEAKAMLSRLCEAGREIKFVKEKFTNEHRIRLTYELQVINKLGMADYMLIVWDIAREARSRNIPFSTRGSVAGSLVAYLIGISWIDPIKFNTTFERFLTEDRLSLPDIDMDFSSSRRMELVEYLRTKYGADNIAHIVNFGIFHPKGAIKDVSKVYGISFTEVNNVTKSISDNITQWSEINNTKEVREFKEKYPIVWTVAENILELTRHRGVHASGVVLTPKNNIHWTPTAWSTIEDKETKDRVTEFDMYALEELGIIKLDFLGQTTLDVIQTALKNIVKFKDKELKTLDDLFKKVISDLADEKVFEQIRAGNLAGLFQMGTSRGMKDLVVAMQCKNIEDIIICITLYRSAILEVGAHTKYINRRFGREKISYIHPKMSKVLDSSEGIFLFQEQVMEMPQVLAGFTASESDNFRKGIKQKDSEKFEKWKVRFVTGCKAHSNIDEKTALKIWEEIHSWSSYGFNRCIDENTPIQLADGEKLIKDVLPGDIVKTYSTSEDKFYYDLVEKVYDNGYMDCVKITLEDGKEITCTLEHKFLCEDGKFRELKEVLEIGYSISVER